MFRDDHDALLDVPWAATLLTAPAANATAIAKNEPAALPKLEATPRERVENVLAVAVAFDQTSLVLGAWGCGVFGNDPAKVARAFAERLVGPGRYSHAFEHVTFAVLDRGGETIGASADVFGTTGTR